MTRKAFLLADALVCLVILTAMCLLSLSMAKVMERGRKGEDDHLVRSGEILTEIYASLPECSGCILP
jgi:hypothetical protein